MKIKTGNLKLVEIQLVPANFLNWKIRSNPRMWNPISTDMRNSYLGAKNRLRALTVTVTTGGPSAAGNLPRNLRDGGPNAIPTGQKRTQDLRTLTATTDTADAEPMNAQEEARMTITTLQDLFEDTLKDIYYVERTLVKTLPDMAKKANSSTLKEAIESHLTETEDHVRRLERIFELMNFKAQAKKCEAIEGLVKEAKEVVGEIGDDETRDAAIISSAQAVEHYEIARYGTLASWALEVGSSEVAELLEQTLEEEKAADEKLSSIAEDAINQRVAA